MPTLTIFTSTYNRAHTLPRTYTSLCQQTCKDFEWLIVDDGSTDNTRELAEAWMEEQKIPIRYIYQENGGLYTGYNTAYANIDSELNTCVDSDDFMPDNAVELILNLWKEKGSDKYCGIVGLDFNVKDGQAIGGYFPTNLKEVFFVELRIKGLHYGDVKPVLRTDLMKKVAPQIGFPNEKDFNPLYMQLQLDNEYPMLVLNKNICWVDYQYQIGGDSMSKNIFRQYFNSPKSFAKTRLLEMSLKHSNLKYRFRSAIHYISSCIISKDKDWLKNTPNKILTLTAVPFGILLYSYLRYKVSRYRN